MGSSLSTDHKEKTFSICPRGYNVRVIPGYKIPSNRLCHKAKKAAQKSVIGVNERVPFPNHVLFMKQNTRCFVNRDCDIHVLRQINSFFIIIYIGFSFVVGTWFHNRVVNWIWTERQTGGVFEVRYFDYSCLDRLLIQTIPRFLTHFLFQAYQKTQIPCFIHSYKRIQFRREVIRRNINDTYKKKVFYKMNFLIKKSYENISVEN